MKKSEFKTGEFLYEIQSDELSVITPEDERVFIHTGYKNGDGYGILIGWHEHEIKRASGHGNWCWGGMVRLATEEEKEHFMNKLMWQEKNIRQY